MRRTAPWPLVASLLLAGATSTSSPALAQSDASPAATVKRCASAYEQAQRHQARSELIAAREQAGVCAAMACPAEIVSYCAKLAEELDASIPTIVVALTDRRGRDVDARVFVDDREVQRHLDGRPLRLDPGPHRLRLAPGTGKPVELQVTVRNGEQNRRIQAEVYAEPPPARADTDATRIGYAPSVIAFSIGAVGIAVGAATGIMALSQDAELSERCDASAASCDPAYEDEIDRAANLGYASTIGFVLGGAGIAAGVILAIVAARSDDDGPLQPTNTGYRLRF